MSKNHLYSLFLIVLLAAITGCSSEVSLHDLRGKARAPWYEPVPYGMKYVKQGTFQLGASDELTDNPLNTIRNVSVRSFWIDDTEITNNEYRQFVIWARDSIAASLSFKAGIDYYMARDNRDQIKDPVQVDWSKIHTIWRDDNQDVIDAIEPLYYQGAERIFNKKEIDLRKINYKYAYIDLKKAASRSNSYNYDTQSYGGNISSRADFIVSKETFIYPDTLVWIRDFTYSYNEPWTLKYFHHEAFLDYPVVGVTWEQANAFCHWRTKVKGDFLMKNEIQPIHAYRLPTEVEWEYAARGGLQNSKYPWGNYYATNCKGCYVANFKPRRGDYVADSRYSSKTMKVGSYDPNDYGLFDMAGNVAEWTSTAYDIMGYDLISDMNPELSYDAQPDDPPSMKRKVVRGGSWKDPAYFIQVSTRDFEYQDSANSYVGFRCVMNAIEDERKIYN